MAKFDARCHWCQCEVVKLSSVREMAFNITHSIVSYFDSDIPRTKDIATVDHVTRVADGGTNDDSNLVLSCVCCNLLRDKIITKNPRTLKPFYWEQCLVSKRKIDRDAEFLRACEFV